MTENEKKAVSALLLHFRTWCMHFGHQLPAGADAAMQQPDAAKAREALLEIVKQAPLPYPVHSADALLEVGVLDDPNVAGIDVCCENEGLETVTALKLLFPGWEPVTGEVHKEVAG